MPDVSGIGFNPTFQPAGFPGFQPDFAFQYMAAFASSSAPVPAIARVVCQFQLLQRSPEVSETTEKAKGFTLLSQTMST